MPRQTQSSTVNKNLLPAMNNKVKNLSSETLSNNWYTLKKVSYDYLKSNGTWQTQTREAYDRGNGAGILLYNKE